MAVNFIRISDLEIRNGDDQFAGVVANRAGTNEKIYEQKESTVNKIPGNRGTKRSRFRSPGFHQNRQIPQNSPHFTRFIVDSESACRFVFNDYELAQDLL